MRHSIVASLRTKKLFKQIARRTNNQTDRQTRGLSDTAAFPEFSAEGWRLPYGIVASPDAYLDNYVALARKTLVAQRC